MTYRILQGDALTILRTLPTESVHCCVTSPPYFGLRSYLPASHPDKTLELGSETSPDEYIAKMVEVFREVRRVLRRDGCLFVNIGDSYAANRSYQVRDNKHVDVGNTAGSIVPTGLKPKDLLMMPSRLALSLQSDGWWLRSMMPWVKRSCMPESCTDRPTSAIEYVFMLTRSASYFWDAEAVKKRGIIEAGTLAAKGSAERSQHANGRPPEYAVYSGERNFRNSDLFFSSLEEPHGLILDVAGEPLALDVNPYPFPDAHFATFPPKLVEPLIKAATSEKGCCPACGKQWVRELMRDGNLSAFRPSKYDISDPRFRTKRNMGARYQAQLDEHPMQTLGFRPSCSCAPGDPVPSVVLDPFSGAGTTLLVADRLQRNAIGIELSAEYVAMSERRIRGDAPLLAAAE